MKSEKKTLLENFISLGMLQIVSYIIPLLSLPYLSRVLGVEKFGLVFFAFAFMQYFILLTDYGFGLSATREIAVNRHNSNNLSNIFSAVTFIKFFFLIISFLILSIMIFFIPKLNEHPLIFLLSFLMVVGNAIYPVWFFQGIEKMKYITFLNILAKIIFLAAIFVFVKDESDYVIVPLLNSLGFLVAGFLGMYFAIKHFGVKLYIPKWNSIKKQFIYSSDFLLSRVSVSAYTNTNTFCLGLTGSSIMVGYYVAAEKIYLGISGVMHQLASALYPFIAKYKNIILYKKIYISAIIFNSVITVVLFIFAPNIITLFYGAEMAKAYIILRIFCIANLILIPHVLLGYPLLGALGYTKEANLTVIISSIIHVAGLFILFITNHMTIISIALLYMLTEYIIFGMRLFLVIKYKLLVNKES